MISQGKSNNGGAGTRHFKIHLELLIIENNNVHSSYKVGTCHSALILINEDEELINTRCSPSLPAPCIYGMLRAPGCPF